MDVENQKFMCVKKIVINVINAKVFHMLSSNRHDVIWGQIVLNIGGEGLWQQYGYTLAFKIMILVC